MNSGFTKCSNVKYLLLNGGYDQFKSRHGIYSSIGPVTGPHSGHEECTQSARRGLAVGLADGQRSSRFRGV